MNINTKMLSPGPDIFYDKTFRDTLESHVVYFRTAAKTSSLEVEPHRASVYEADLFGYLSEKGYAASQFWLIMRVNDLFTPHAFGPETEVLLIPDPNEVESIRQAFMATGLISL